MPIPGMDEVESLLDPPIEVPDFEPELVDILPRGYLSVSQMTTFLKCPYQWYLRYVQGISTKTSGRMMQGIQVHQAVEAMMNEKVMTGKQLPLDVATDVFVDAFEKQKPMVADWEEQDPNTFKDTGVQCTKVFWQEAAPTAMPVLVEKAFHTTIATPDGKTKLPVLGRIDSIQVQAINEKEYNDIRESVVGQTRAHAQLVKTAKDQGKKPEPFKLAGVKKPLRIHDLKVVTDKWSEADLTNDMQFAIYAGVEHIPDVQVDQLVKGRAKVPRPRYETLTGVMDPGFISHVVDVAADVAKSITTAHFPKCDPSAWHCSEKWCGVWHACRGKKQKQR